MDILKKVQEIADKNSVTFTSDEKGATIWTHTLNDMVMCIVSLKHNNIQFTTRDLVEVGELYIEDWLDGSDRFEINIDF